MTKLVANSALVIGFVTAVLGLLSQFGVGITDSQLGAITGAIGAGIALLGAWYSPSVPSVGRRA